MNNFILWLSKITIIIFASLSTAAFWAGTLSMIGINFGPVFMMTALVTGAAIALAMGGGHEN